MIEIFAYILIAIGLIFDLLGVLGLIRFPDIYSRLQAATKTVTLGTVSILLGVALYGISKSHFDFIFKALLCAGFTLLTAPVAAHAIARASLKFGIKVWRGEKK